jgi:hypothetical protein
MKHSINIIIPVVVKVLFFIFCSEQELLFYQLVLLFRNANGDVQNATREALLRLNVCPLLYQCICFFSLFECLQHF